MKYKTDIVIFGAGIAGLWLHALLRSRGYNSLLLETESIGGIQSMGSQGILHSGLKYAFAGKMNKLAQSISAMPDRWREAIKGQGDIDLSSTQIEAETQLLMIPSGLMSGLIKLVTKKTLGSSVRSINKDEWPEHIHDTGFKGQVIYMDEPVLNVPSLVRALAEPHKDSIRKIAWDQVQFNDNIITIDGNVIEAKHILFTAAGSNHETAVQLGHDDGLKTQKRPLLMGIMRPAPFPLHAHLVGSSDKPVATITTHTDKNGDLVWYLGAQVAERPKDDNPQKVIDMAIHAFKKYMPTLDLTQMLWSTWAVDRVEGQSSTEGWMPDTPVIHSQGRYHYCWPTKLTFAPMLGDKILEKLKLNRGNGDTTDWSFLPEAPYAETVWDRANDWTK